MSSRGVTIYAKNKASIFADNFIQKICGENSTRKMQNKPSFTRSGGEGKRWGRKGGWDIKGKGKEGRERRERRGERVKRDYVRGL